MPIHVRLVMILLVLFCLAGCARKIPHMLAHDFGDQGTKRIAVLSVRTEESDPGTASLLRSKLIEELHFKGYPEILPKWIDEKLSADAPEGQAGEPTPQWVGKRLNVDAILYTTLREGRMSTNFLNSRIVMDVEFEMKSARTGESLWSARHRAIHRNYGFSRRSLELKSCQFYEPLIHEVLNRALETLPDGPEAIDS